MKYLLIPALLTASISTLLAQALPAHLQGKLIYPVFDTHPYMGVAKAKNTALKSIGPQKVVLDITMASGDSSQLNRGLREAARTYNLHVANGTKRKELDMALVIHSGTVRAILDDKAYEKMYGIKNPNSDLLKAFKKEGIAIYVCSQSLTMMQIDPDDISSEVEPALSAKTAMTYLQSAGYDVLFLRD